MRLRRLLLLSGLASLVLGALAGLQRLGLASAPGAWLAPWHGVVMTGGFAGLLISLERAVALEEPWALGAPALALAGTAGLLAGLKAAPWAYAAAGLWAMAVQARLARRRVDAASIVMALGSLAWAAGMWNYALGGGLAASVLFWAAFPVLVIAGERLELAFQVPPGGRPWWAFQGFVALVLGGAAVSLVHEPAGARLLAAGCLGLALWMLRYDVLGRRAGVDGASRYMARALHVGYCWLAVSALLLGLWSLGQAAFWDGALHSLFLGFMFAMIFAHAPIIFPALTGVPLRWHRGHYAHLGLLSLGLALRCAAPFLASDALKRHGSLCAALALGVFLFNQALSAGLARFSKEPAPC
jgi:hypothetical protein